MGMLKSVRPCFLGLALVHTWIYCSTHRATFQGSLSVMVVLYLAQSAFLLALFCGVRHRTRSGRGVADIMSTRMLACADVIAAVCMALCAVVLCVPPTGIPEAACVVVSCVAGGVGVGWAYMRWGEFYARLDIHLSAPLIFLTMALGSALKTVVDLLPGAPAAVLLVCAAGLTFFAMRRSLRTCPDGPEPTRYFTARTMGSMARMCVGVGVYSFTVGLVQSMLLEATPTPYLPSVLVHHGSEVLLALGMVAWITWMHRGLNFSRSWRVILVLMATALIFEPQMSPEVSSYLLSLVRTAQTFLIVFLFLALADVARHSPYHPMLVFSVGWAAYTLPFMAGKLLGDGLVVLDARTGLAMSAVVWVLVLVMLFVLDEAALGNRLVFTELNAPDDGDTLAGRIGAVQLELNEQERAAAARPADIMSLRCDAVSEQYGLTPREHEILEMLVRGRSKAHIAEAFLISENTVRGHVKHIYAKLDVHGKQELLDKVEAARV